MISDVKKETVSKERQLVTMAVKNKSGTDERVVLMVMPGREKESLRLFCTSCLSFGCIHVRFAWTQVNVQAMMCNQAIKPLECNSCHSKNDSDARYCTNCGVKM